MAVAVGGNNPRPVCAVIAPADEVGAIHAPAVLVEPAAGNALAAHHGVIHIAVGVCMNFGNPAFRPRFIGLEHCFAHHFDDIAAHCLLLDGGSPGVILGGGKFLLERAVHTDQVGIIAPPHVGSRIGFFRRTAAIGRVGHIAVILYQHVLHALYRA